MAHVGNQAERRLISILNWNKMLIINSIRFSKTL